MVVTKVTLAKPLSIREDRNYDHNDQAVIVATVLRKEHGAQRRSYNLYKAPESALEVVPKVFVAVPKNLEALEKASGSGERSAAAPSWDLVIRTLGTNYVCVGAQSWWRA